MLATKSENIAKCTSFKIYVSLHCKMCIINCMSIISNITDAMIHLWEKSFEFLKHRWKIVVKLLLFVRLNGQDYFLFNDILKFSLSIFIYKLSDTIFKGIHTSLSSSKCMKRVFIRVDWDKLFTWTRRKEKKRDTKMIFTRAKKKN